MYWIILVRWVTEAASRRLDWFTAPLFDPSQDKKKILNFVGTLLIK